MPRRVRLRKRHGDRELPQSQRMLSFTDLASAPSHPLAPFTGRLRLAVAAYLARFKGTSREHTESDLRRYLSRRAEHGLDPLGAQRPHLEVYIRWMQGDPPVQALRRLLAVLGCGRVLPDLCRRRRARAFGNT
jgi:hypothetical protein